MASAPARFAGDGDITHVDEVVPVPPVPPGAAAPDREGDHTARRRAAEGAAQVAESRATAAATQAKTAIAAAARAAALADAAAQEAEQADAAVRVAAQAETRAAADAARRAAHRAPAPRVAMDDMTRVDLLRDGGIGGEDTARHRTAPVGHRARDETGDVTAAVPSATGRAARRRAATDETTMFAPVTDAPVTDAIPTSAPDDDSGPATAVAPAVVDGPVAAPVGATRRSRRRGLLRRPTPPVLAAAAAGGVLALAGVMFAGTVVRTTPQPAAVIESAVPSQESMVPVLPGSVDGAGDDEGSDAGTGTDVDPSEDRSADFLQKLRAAGVPTSRGGLAETEAADLVCNELSDGVDEARIARALPASLPTVSRAQAADLVEIARDDYCA